MEDVIIPASLDHLRVEAPARVVPDFGAFFEANVDRARSIAWRLVGGNAAAAEDVVQDAFVKAYRSLHKFRGDAKLESWFFRIVINEAHNHRRWRKVREAFGAVDAEETPEPAPRKASDPLAREAIASALEELSGKQRECFVLVHMEGFTVREVSGMLGMAEGTVKHHLHRALRKLRASLAAVREEILA